MSGRSPRDRFEERIRQARERLPARAWTEDELTTVRDRFAFDNNRENQDSYEHQVAGFINRQTRLDKPGAYDLAMLLVEETARYAKAGAKQFAYRTQPSADVDTEGRILMKQDSYDLLREYVQFRLDRMKGVPREGADRTPPPRS